MVAWAGSLLTVVVVFHFSFPYLWASRLDFTPCGVKPVRRGCAGLVQYLPYLVGVSARRGRCCFLRHSGQTPPMC